MKGANNPANVRRSTVQFLGLLPGDGAFGDYDTLMHGVRAGMECVLASFRHHGCHTVGQIIDRYAPFLNDQGKVENPGNPGYKRFVANRLGVGVDDTINPLDLVTLKGFAAAQAWFETNTILEDDVLEAAARSALGVA